MTKRPAEGQDNLPGAQPAALAALSISESLILTLIEAGALDPQAARRCLLDAAAGFDRDTCAAGPQSVRHATAALIDDLLRQIEALAPRG
jgi:hypothetical protein